MEANDKFEATFHPFEAVLGDLPPANQTFSTHDEGPAVLDAVSIADMLCDQLQLFTEEGGNDLQGEYVDEVTLGGRIVTVDWSNGQQFRIEVIEVMR